MDTTISMAEQYEDAVIAIEKRVAQFRGELEVGEYQDFNDFDAFEMEKKRNYTIPMARNEFLR